MSDLVPKDSKKRKVNHAWGNSETAALIAAVERRPLLWVEKYSYRNFESHRKAQEWKEICQELNIEGIDVNEVRTKWKCLEKNFKNCPQRKITPKWSKSLSFLLNAGEKSPKVNQKSPKAKQTPVSYTFSPLRLHNFKVNQPSTRKRTPSSLKSIRASSSTLYRPDIPNSSEAVVQLPDLNATFCDYILAELCSLSDVESRHLRKVLTEQLYNFLDDNPEDKLIQQSF